MIPRATAVVVEPRSTGSGAGASQRDVVPFARSFVVSYVSISFRLY
jgi:hypothetical protein